MSSIIKKPKLNGLPGNWIISPKLRENLKIPRDILSGNANSWNDTKAIIHNYFKDTTTNEPSFKHFYENTLRALDCLKDSQGSDFANRCRKYLKAKEVKNELIEEFINTERLKKIQKTKLVMQQEAEIASMGVTTNEIINLAEKYSKKRKIIDEEFNNIDDIAHLNDLYDKDCFTENPFNFDEEIVKDKVTIIKNRKIYDFHVPNKQIVSPNKPIIQKEDYESLSCIFDIVMSHNNKDHSESPFLLETFKQYKKDERLNNYLKSVPGALNFIKETVLNKSQLDESEIWNFKSNSSFIKMMKRVICDFILNCERESPLDPNDERTFAAEAIVNIFKSFGVICRMTFKWFEKQCDQNKTSWLPLNDFSKKDCKTKLLDGLGVSANKKVCLFIESSGSEKDTGHRIEDCLKNLKSSSDFLKFLLSSFKHSNVITMKKLKIPCINIIGNKVTLLLCSISSKEKWNFIEARSCIIPTTADEKNHLVKLFELLAFLKHIVDTDVKIINDLEMESLGLAETDYISVEEYFS